MPSLQALRALEASVRLQSFTAAAVELAVTHGAISRQIDKLEQWTGKRLFVRASRRMAPTEAARAFVTQTREALRILQDAFGHPLLPRSIPGLRLSTTHAIARLWLLPRLATIHETYPALIAAVETTTALDAGWSETIDVAIRYGPGSWPGVHSTRLGGETLFPVASPALLARHAEWTDAPFLTTPYQSWRSWFDAFRLSIPQHALKALELPDAGLALDAAAAGLGIALARGRLVEGYLARGALVHVSAERLPDSYAYYLVSPPRADSRLNIGVLEQALLCHFG